MKGIDVSDFQSDLDFSKVDAEVCIIKATEGLTYTNPYLKSQYTKAKANGIKVGYYHYLRANDAIQEAKHFLQAVDGLDNHCKLIIDAEEPTETAGISARTRAFADYLISQGKEVCIYTGLAFWNDEILPICKDIPLWVAAYGSNRPNVKSVGWQYTDKDGLDLNVFDEGILLSGINSISPVPTIKIYNYISQLQIALNTWGKNIIVDGFYGPKTLAACPLLKQNNGRNGNVVKWLQERVGVSQDGIFGIDTYNAVVKFQRAMGLSVDGIVGQGTWADLLR